MSAATVSKQIHLLLAVGVLVRAAVAAACETCRPRVQAQIFNEAFAGRLAVVLLPLLLVVTLIVVAAHAWGRGHAEDG